MASAIAGRRRFMWSNLVLLLVLAPVAASLWDA
jgi:hypothetical protein